MVFVHWLVFFSVVPADAQFIVDVIRRQSISFAFSRAETDALFPLAALRQL